MRANKLNSAEHFIWKLGDQFNETGRATRKTEIKRILNSFKCGFWLQKMRYNFGVTLYLTRLLSEFLTFSSLAITYAARLKLNTIKVYLNSQRMQQVGHCSGLVMIN